MPRMTDLVKEKVVTLFEEKHYSCNMIAKEVGFSRGGIKKFLNLAGYDTSKAIGRHMKVECLNCGETFDLPTCRGRKARFCSTKCYFEYIRDGEYKPWRQGQRIARAILRTYVSRMFGKNQGFVSHHKDGDDSHNEFNNLMAFPDQSNHLAYHRHHRVACVLLDGASLLK